MNNRIKKTLWIIGGVLGGYIVNLVLASSTTALLHNIWPASAAQDPGFLVKLVDVTYSTLYLVVGAYAAAWISNNISSSVAYGTIFFILGIVTLLSGMDTVNPLWYQLYFIVMAIPAAYAGGILRIRKRKVQTI